MNSSRLKHFRSLRTRIWLLAVLLALPVMGQRLVAAQEPGSQPAPARPDAAPAANVQAGEGSLKKEEVKSEEEQANVYRHSATVQWVSRLLNTDVETTAKGFELINFAIIVLAVGIPLFKILPQTLRKRKARLGAELEVAQAKTADANERLKVVEARLAGLDAEIQAFRAQVEEETKGDEVRIKASIEEETARIVKSAEQEIQIAGVQAQRGLKQFAANLAIDRAMSRLQLDEETDRALIREFGIDLGSIGNEKSSASRNGGRA